jgi:hypothetical protein
VDCTVSSSVPAAVTFLPGRVPLPGELVTVKYRGRVRAVARMVDAASLAAEAAGGAVGTARWLGRVVRPVARSAEDCEAAARAILSFATNRAAAVSGTYAATNPAGTDIWPGDALALGDGAGATTTVLVRAVAISERGAAPEALAYRIAFANDWAEGLGLQLTETFAKDAPLPVVAIPNGGAAHVLTNLPGLAVTAAGGSSLTVDAGTDPPAGGGFEVRRRDGGFGTGTSGSASGDLVLRSPVRTFSIPRAGVEERFFVRMYDAATVPLYSRRSSALVTHLPLS